MKKNSYWCVVRLVHTAALLLFRTFNVLNAQPLHKPRREHSTCESSSEDGSELRIEATDAHVLKLETWRENGI